MKKAGTSIVTEGTAGNIRMRMTGIPKHGPGRISIMIDLGRLPPTLIGGRAIGAAARSGTRIASVVIEKETVTAIGTGIVNLGNPAIDHTATETMTGPSVIATETVIGIVIETGTEPARIKTAAKSVATAIEIATGP